MVNHLAKSNKESTILLLQNFTMLQHCFFDLPRKIHYKLQAKLILIYLLSYGVKRGCLHPRKLLQNFTMLKHCFFDLPRKIHYKLQAKLILIYLLSYGVKRGCLHPRKLLQNFTML